VSITNISDSVEAVLVQARAKRLPDLVFKKHPLTNLFKHERLNGELKKVPVKFAYGAGGSGNFQNAQGNQSDDSNVAFLVTLGKDYAVKKIQNTDIEAALASGGIVDLLTDRIESTVKMAADSLERALTRSGFSELGQIATGGISSATITLQPGQAKQFYPGLKCVFASSLTAGSLRNSGATGTVLSIDTGANTCTFTQTIATIGGGTIQAGDFVFRQGDKTGATPTMVAGLAGWLPIVRPTTGDNWYGVDRSVDPESLAGCYIDGRNMNLKVAIETAASKLVDRGGANPDVVAMSAANWNKLAQVLQGYGGAQVVDYNGRIATASFKSIRLVTVAGALDCIAIPMMDDTAVYVLDTSTWYLGSPTGDIIKNANPNGKTLTVYNDDAQEIRERTFGQCYCDAPGFNVVIQMA